MKEYPLSPRTLPLLYCACHSYTTYSTAKLISSCHTLLSGNFSGLPLSSLHFLTPQWSSSQQTCVGSGDKGGLEACCPGF